MSAPKMILVVDDDPAMQKVLSLGLQRLGHRATVARHGREALDLLESGSLDPDCVLLDIRMPVMTGREALPLIKAMKPNLPVIMLTAFNDLTNGVESMKDGAFDYVVKPVRLDDLAGIISKALGHRNVLLEKAEAAQRERARKEELEREAREREVELDEVHRRLRKSNMETAMALAETIEAKDRYTQGHCMRVRTLCIAIAQKLGLPADRTEHLEHAALLHDIGKIGIPERVLNKPDNLTEEEVAIMRSHPVIGEQILSKVEFFRPCVQAVRQHHERWDGKGYPDGLAGEAIDLLAQIITVADSFDAMAVSRPYRKALAFDAAVETIRSGSGRQFSPRIVQVFLEVLPGSGYQNL